MFGNMCYDSVKLVKANRIIIMKLAKHKKYAIKFKAKYKRTFINHMNLQNLNQHKKQRQKKNAKCKRWKIKDGS